MEEYKKSIELAEQITKYLKRMLSPEEETELKKQLQDYPDGEKLLSNILDKQVIASKKEIYKLFDTNKNWEKVRVAIAKKPSNKLRGILRYAAVLALPVAIAAFWLLARNHQGNSPAYIADAHFEPLKTMLELPGGKHIALDSTSNVTKELNEFGITLAEDSGLDYSVADSVTPIKEEYHKITVPRGGEYHLKLADGTHVWIFAESEIRFPTSFKGNKREVYLSGEAYFEVHHDPTHPFLVKTKALDVKVLGTSFNVKAYNDMESVETSLVEGLVSVKGNVLSPNTQAIFHKNTGDLSFRKINGDSYRLRKERMFVFDEERLDDILHEMARWYDFVIFYQNPEMADKRFGFKLEKYEQVDSLLRILELTGEVSFSMQGRTLVVKNANECSVE